MDKLYKDYLIYIDHEIACIFGMIEEVEEDARVYCSEYYSGSYEGVLEKMLNTIWVKAKNDLTQLYYEAAERGCEIEDLNELFEGTGI